MKNLYIITLSLCLFFTNTVFGQVIISERSEQLKEPTPTEIIYDSLTNFVLINKSYNHMIGQKVFFYGRLESIIACEKYGSGFYTEKVFNKKWKRILKEGFDSSIKPNLSSESYHKHYFIIEEVFLKLPDGDYDYVEASALKLRKEDDGQIVYYFNNSRIPQGWWTTVGFLIKARETYIGKRYALIRDWPIDNWLRKMSDDEKLTGIVCPEYVYGKKRTIWKCKDVVVRYNEAVMKNAAWPSVALIMENEDGQYEDSYVYLSFRPNDFHPDSVDEYLLPPFRDGKLICIFEPAEEYEARINRYLENEKSKLSTLIKAFGEENGQLIFVGHVKLGFTDTMCKLALGEPDDINKTTGSWGEHQQWVYRKSDKTKYLYFENGVLTSVQE